MASSNRASRLDVDAPSPSDKLLLAKHALLAAALPRPVDPESATGPATPSPLDSVKCAVRQHPVLVPLGAAALGFAVVRSGFVSRRIAGIVAGRVAMGLIRRML